jgi:prepilin-type N-terminal cleavage/methylation domain-containing protein/prepilin-type processing-associated H-X9-DG protein
MFGRSVYGRPSKLRARAFTLVELLVVVGIIAILMGILLATLSRVQEKSRRTACISNLRQLGVAMILYSNENRGYLPNGNPALTWDDYPGTNAVMVHFNSVYVKAPKVFNCPADRDPPPLKILTADPNLPESARISYVFYSMYWAPEYGPLLVKFRGQAPLAWDLDGGNTGGLLMNHKGGGNVVFADGHAEWQEQKLWDEVNWPNPATKFFPTPP